MRVISSLIKLMASELIVNRRKSITNRMVIKRIIHRDTKPIKLKNEGLVIFDSAVGSGQERRGSKGFRDML